MLKDGLGRVLFVGPAYVTKWMGASVAHSPAMMKAMTSNGYRLARVEDRDRIAAAEWAKVVGEREQPKAKRPRIGKEKVATSTPQ
jgi:cytidylate kinase